MGALGFGTRPLSWIPPSCCILCPASPARPLRRSARSPYSRHRCRPGAHSCHSPPASRRPCLQVPESRLRQPAAPVAAPDRGNPSPASSLDQFAPMLPTDPVARLPLLPSCASSASATRVAAWLLGAGAEADATEAAAADASAPNNTYGAVGSVGCASSDCGSAADLAQLHAELEEEAPGLTAGRAQAHAAAAAAHAQAGKKAAVADEVDGYRGATSFYTAQRRSFEGFMRAPITVSTVCRRWRWSGPGSPAWGACPVAPHSQHGWRTDPPPAPPALPFCCAARRRTEQLLGSDLLALLQLCWPAWRRPHGAGQLALARAAASHTVSHTPSYLVPPCSPSRGGTGDHPTYRAATANVFRCAVPPFPPLDSPAPPLPCSSRAGACAERVFSAAALYNPPFPHAACVDVPSLLANVCQNQPVVTNRRSLPKCAPDGAPPGPRISTLLDLASFEDSTTPFSRGLFPQPEPWILLELFLRSCSYVEPFWSASGEGRKGDVKGRQALHRCSAGQGTRQALLARVNVQDTMSKGGRRCG